jgi:hypothetical protein
MSDDPAGAAPSVLRSKGDTMRDSVRSMIVLALSFSLVVQATPMAQLPKATPMPQGKTPLPQPKVAVAKHKNHMTFDRKLEFLLSKRGYQDPVLPAIVHGFKRYLAGAQNPNEFDRIVRDNVAKSKMSRVTIEKLVKNFDAVAPQLKARWFPAEYTKLDVKLPVDMKLLANSLVKVSDRLRQQAAGIPVSRQHPRAVRAPIITSVNPSGLDFVLMLTPGGGFTLFGHDFAPVAVQNRIQIGRGDPAAFVVLHEVTPGSATAVELRAVAPSSLTPGAYSVRVQSNGALGNIWAAFVQTPPGPAPRLDSIAPATCQQPGQRVILDGSNFTAETTVELEFLDVTGIRYVRAGRPSVERRSATQIFFTIPQDTWPGDYGLTLWNPGSGPSAARTLSVCAPRYRVQLERIDCIDESDPEGGTIGLNDEVFVIFSGTTESMSRGMVTPEYEGFYDGRTRRFGTTGPYLFLEDGTTVPVATYLALAVSPFESDNYDRGELLATISTLGGIASSVSAAVAVLLYGATVAAASGVGAIAAAVFAAVGLVVALVSNDNDPLGERTEVISARDLQVMTAATGTVSHEMTFTNDDDTGSYRVVYRIIRDATP